MVSISFEYAAVEPYTQSQSWREPNKLLGLGTSPGVSPATIRQKKIIEFYEVKFFDNILIARGRLY